MSAVYTHVCCVHFLQQCVLLHAVQVLYDWVDSLEGFDSLSYSLVSAFPKRVFGGDSRGQSLEAAGLVPQGALFVLVHDDDDGAAAGKA